jgi:subtilase family serine protease
MTPATILICEPTMKKNLCLQIHRRAPFIGRLAVAACLSLFAPFMLPAQTVGRQAIQGCIPTAVSILHLQPTSTLAATQHLRLAISFPLRNPEAASNLLEQIYDPTSPNYHHYLTPQEFTDQFGPSKQDYEAVMAFAKANGLTVVGAHPNRLLLDVSGSVTDIEKVFKVTLQNYQHPVENRTFYAPNVEPSLALSVPVAGVIGLNDYTLPRPLYHLASAGQMATNQPLYGSAPGGYGSYFGNDFRNAYAQGTTLTGAGQTVALFEAADYFPTDIVKYASSAGLPLVPIQKVSVDGGPVPPFPGDGVNVEVALDIEMAMDMAPGLSNIIVYEGPADMPTVDGDILSQIADDNSARQISSSWLIDDSPQYAAIYTQFALQGQTFFQASGDNGAYYTGIFQSEDSPLVTLVGGTSLFTDPFTGAYLIEAAWNWGNGVAGGGGISPLYAIPSWQKSVNMSTNQGSAIYRNVPDVALTADNIFVFSDGGMTNPYVGGTSAAAPLWAGFAALINQQAAISGKPPVGFLNPAIYAIGQGTNYYRAFHDITSGANTTVFSPFYYQAASGYDLCTGWGTPNGQGLINALVKPDLLQVTPTNDFAASFPVGQFPGAISQNYTLTNAGGSSLAWSLSGTPVWLDASATGGLLATNGQTNVILSLNSAAANLAVGNYAATLVFSNMDTGAIQLRQATLQVLPLMSNGGFETGDFTGWSLSGNLTNIFVSDNADFVHSGNYAARLGPVGSLGYLSQTVAAIAGRAYTLSFWLENPNGGLPNEFNVSWNGNALYDQTNLPAFTWTNLQFDITATGITNVLQFGARNDPQFFNLDDVSLTLKPSPAFNLLSVNGNQVTLSWNAASGTVYQLQYTTNLVQPNWFDLGGRVTGADATVNAMMPIGPDPQRFYRFQILH